MLSRFRSLESSCFLRIRRDFGVTSSSSSLSIKSSACSRDRIFGGVRRSASSAEEERVLVRCFVLQTFSSMSSARSEEHTSELQSRFDLVCRLLLDKKKKQR